MSCYLTQPQNIEISNNDIVLWEDTMIEEVRRLSLTEEFAIEDIQVAKSYPWDAIRLNQAEIIEDSAWLYGFL